MRAFFFLLGEIATAVFLVALAAGLGLAFLHLPEGRALLIGEAHQAAASAGLSLTIEGVEGRVPFDLSIAHVAVADAQGVWLDAEGIRLEIDTRAVLDRWLVVRQLSAEKLRLERLPPSNGGSPGGSPALPVLPLPVRLDDLHIDDATVGEAVAGRPLNGRLQADAVADPAENRLARGRIRVEAMGAGLDTDWSLTPSILSLPRLEVALGANRVSGTLDLALTTGLATGQVDANLDDLAALAALAGQPLSGSAAAQVSLEGVDGRQNAVASVDLRDVKGGGATVGTASLRADVRDVTGTPNGRIEAKAERIASGTLAARSLTAEANGGMSGADVTLAVKGANPDTPDADLRARLASANGETTVRLERADATLRGETLRLRAPSTLTLADNRVELTETRLEGLGSTLVASGRVDGDRVSGRLQVDGVALSLARRFDPTFPADGTATLTASLSGTKAAPAADATLTLRGVTAGALADAGMPPLEARAEARLRDGKVSATGTVASPDRAIDLTLDGAVPLHIDPQTMAPSLPGKAALNARVRGKAQLAFLNTLLAGSGDRVRGTITLDLSADGPVTAPRLGGSAVLAGGGYENRASGAVVTDLAARLEASGDSIALRSLQGRTPGGGTIEGQGAIQPFASDRAIDLRVGVHNARVAANDTATASADADLSVNGSMTGAELSGTVRFNRIDIRVPDRMPPQIVDLKVTEVSGAPGSARPLPRRKPAPPVAGKTATPESSGMAFLRLNVGIESNARIFIRGRGLDAEIGGKLRAEGTAAAPRVTGQLKLVQGRLDLLGKTFSFERFNVDFDGTNPPDPRLDVQARATSNGASVLVLVSGTASAPKVELTSPEGLPQDEVLARVLFGKSVGALGPGEAVQLAQSVAELSGVGGTDITGRLRRSLGLDRLQFLSSSTGGTGGAVQAGRYISDRVYVGVTQEVGGSSSAQVQVDITNNIQAEAQVGTTGGSRVGLKFEWEY